MMRTFALLGFALALSAAPAGAAFAAGASSQSVASQRVASFAVANMTCATCPITVKKAMSGVKGVRSVKIDFNSKTATVQFDPKATNPAAIAAASTNAGFPAKPRG